MEKSYDFLNVLSDVCMNLEYKTPEIETSAFRRIGRFYLPTGSSKKPVTELVIYENVLPQEFLPKYADKMIIESLAPSVLYSTFEKLYKKKFENLSNLKLMASDKNVLSDLQKIDAEMHEWIDGLAKYTLRSDVPLIKSAYSVVEDSNNLRRFLAMHESLMRFPLEEILA